MESDMGYWIFQAKDLTFSKLEQKVDVPIHHWFDNHSLCGELCYSNKEESEGKVAKK